MRQSHANTRVATIVFNPTLLKAASYAQSRYRHGIFWQNDLKQCCVFNETIKSYTRSLDLDLSFAKRADLFLGQPLLQASIVELVLAGRQDNDCFFSLKPTKAYCAFVIYILLQFFRRQLLYHLQRQPFTNTTDFLLQLKQLFIRHLVGINVVIVLCLKSHREDYIW